MINKTQGLFSGDQTFKHQHTSVAGGMSSSASSEDSLAASIKILGAQTPRSSSPVSKALPAEAPACEGGCRSVICSSKEWGQPRCPPRRPVKPTQLHPHVLNMHVNMCEVTQETVNSDPPGAVTGVAGGEEEAPLLLLNHLDMLQDHNVIIFFKIFLKIFIYLFLERGKRARRRGRETSMCGWFPLTHWGPRLGIEPVTPWFASQHSIH